MNEAGQASSPSRLRNARDKVKTIDELASLAESERLRGCSVALAHGAFDLLHMGHVRHLEHARRLGEVLIVTITADKFINKGPGRPVFPQALRAEMLAALEYVDWVGVNMDPTAEPVINAIKPDVYIKGSDYADASEDVTGKIVDEREAVEAHGGRIAFTDDIVFSSSELINRHLNVFDPTVRDYLDGVRKGVGLDGILKLIESISELKVLLVGETIIDEYQYVLPYGQASKEPIIATQYIDREVFAGGVIAAANHVAGFCGEVEVMTVLGSVNSDEELVRESLLPGVKLSPIYRDGAPTIRKTRFVENQYMRKLFEVQHIEDTPLPDESRDQLNQAVSDRAGDYDLVIFTDFGHGMIGRSTIDLATEKSKFLAVNTQSNSANRGYNLITKYDKADYICIDLPEARLAASSKFGNLREIASRTLPRSIDCDKIILTQGKYGCMTYERGVGTQEVPAITDTVVDTMGAGDAFFVVTAPLVAAGAAMEHVGLIGNVVGAVKVGILGHRSSVDKVTVIKALTGLLK